MNKIIIIGGGGHAKVLISIIRKTNKYSILGYTDICDKGDLLGVTYLGTDEILKRESKYGKFDLALGIGYVKTAEVRIHLFHKMKDAKFNFPVIISPSAIVNEDVSIEEGTVVFDLAVVNSGSRLGRGIIVNTNSTIEHDCRIGDFVHVSPGATLSGGVEIGENTLIGTGANVIQCVKIAKNCIIGAGSTIVRNCLETGTYIGNPAKKIK